MAVLFNITHDADNLDEYDSTVVDGGDLSTGLPGLASTTAKMEALIDDATSIYGQKNQGAPGSNEIRYRFYIDPNTLTMADGNMFMVLREGLSDTPWAANLCRLRRDDPNYTLRFTIEDDRGWVSNTDVTLTDAEHCVEIHVERETGDGNNNGRIRLWVGESLELTDAAIQNFNIFALLSNFRLGAVAGIDFPGTQGTLHLDEFVANDDGSEIGPVTPPTGQPMHLRATTVPHMRQWHPRIG